MVSRRQIDAVVQKLVNAYQPERVILFGSYAYGTATEDSDVDLCVVKEDARSAYAKQLELNLLLADRDFSIDILALQPSELESATIHQFIRWEIKNKGVVVYEQQRD
jgi:predicted nucleotidyltransferase